MVVELEHTVGGGAGGRVITNRRAMNTGHPTSELFWLAGVVGVVDFLGLRLVLIVSGQEFLFAVA